MTKLRKAFLAVAVTAVITTMTGFIPAASAAPQEGKKISHIGLMVQDMSNPFFSAMERNAKQAAAKIGATLNEWKGL
ncbi:LacI family transcriptional regulator, partial [Klebsiella oxytoca]|nr:LacI family transcriptional regulator [Klebsiella oxytoca]MRG42011.1 LacI family transcriptional regulator [Klebsiella oxytoca]